MSFHFTQICAFIAYSFRFMGYYSLLFIAEKIDIFQQKQAFWWIFITFAPENQYAAWV